MCAELFAHSRIDENESFFKESDDALKGLLGRKIYLGEPRLLYSVVQLDPARGPLEAFSFNLSSLIYPPLTTSDYMTNSIKFHFDIHSHSVS